jgi:alpha-ketoglutarate-dependent taurine dioxygenase
MRIARLSDALGAEVVGLDISWPLREDAVQALVDAFLCHHLLCIRTEPLSASEFARFARHFGTPQVQLLRERRHPEAPEVSMLESTYKLPQDKPDDLTLVRLSGWHTDDSYFAEPAKATMLQSLALPSRGGETRFANMRRAYDDLPQEMRRALAGKAAIHAYDTRRAPARAVQLTAEEAVETPEVTHPLVRTHEETGVRSIYFNPNRTDRIEGMPRDQSDALLDKLYAHATQPKYQYHHRWRLGDLLLWDNRCLLHAVNTDFPVGEARRHQRILLKGGRPG